MIRRFMGSHSILVTLAALPHCLHGKGIIQSGGVDRGQFILN